MEASPSSVSVPPRPAPSFNEGGFGYRQGRHDTVSEVPVVRVVVHARRLQPVPGSPYPLGSFSQIVHGLVEDGFFVGHVPFYSLHRVKRSDL